MNTQVITFAVETKNGVVQNIGKSSILQPKTSIKKKADSCSNLTHDEFKRWLKGHDSVSVDLEFPFFVIKTHIEKVSFFMYSEMPEGRTRFFYEDNYIDVPLIESNIMLLSWTSGKQLILVSHPDYKMRVTYAGTN